MASYIPTTEAERILWLGNFGTWVVANGTGHGLTNQEVTALTAAIAAADAAVTDNVTAQDAAKASTAHKNDLLGAALAMARDLAQRIQLDPNTTDEDRGNAGLTIRDLEPTTSMEDPVHTTASPLVALDFGERQQIGVHWGPNPQDERNNGRPECALGCEIQYHRGGIPEQESGWVVLVTDSASPYIHFLEEEEPIKYAYRARYLSKKLNYGPFCDPVECTVSV